MRITSKRPSREQIAQDPRSSFLCFRKRSESYAYDWHAHAELELTLIISGRGQRFVGDHVERFGPGDVVLIGPETPHTWAFDSTVKPMEAVVVQFPAAAFAPGPAEFRSLPELFARAKRGLRATGRFRKQIAYDLVTLAAGDEPLERYALLVRILARLSATKDLQPLALAVATYDRDPRVEMLLAHLRDDPSSTVAALAKQMGMGASVFSRWFRREVGKPCVVHVAELRVGQACELLLSTNRSVVDIAFSSGFRNLANFNRWFRRVKGVSPTEYRKSAESPT